ncbi:MAG: galK [Myxococcales bacterium]|nr:galK [Myxococcales bacterium]
MTSTSAPGRVNLIGEHTDYNGGFVLPTPIPQRAYVELSARTDDRVLVWSREMEMGAEYQLGAEHHHGGWVDYVQGCTAVLREAGYRLGGANIQLRSDVPLGIGLSSSAALEVALLRALREAFSLPIDDVTLALLGQRAETELVGAPVSAMDQLVASVGRPGMALFIDTRTMAMRQVPLADADLIVISSGIHHDHAGAEARKRRAECEQAAQFLDVESLRELTEADLWRVSRLPRPLDRRVRHVVTENARVLAAMAALIANDLPALGVLLDRSHASMRDDFEISLPEIDTLVDLARAQPEIYGARLTGSGFGGSIVALSTRGTGHGVAERIAARYRRETSREPTVLIAGELEGL